MPVKPYDPSDWNQVLDRFRRMDDHPSDYVKALGRVGKEVFERTPKEKQHEALAFAAEFFQNMMGLSDEELAKALESWMRWAISQPQEPELEALVESGPAPDQRMENWSWEIVGQWIAAGGWENTKPGMNREQRFRAFYNGMAKRAAQARKALLEVIVKK
jgi:hypothetical protein